MNFELNNTNLQILQKKNKLYTLLNTKFDKAYFKVSKGTFIFALCNNNGIITTELPIEYDGDVKYSHLITESGRLLFRNSVGLILLRYPLKMLY